MLKRACLMAGVGRLENGRYTFFSMQNLTSNLKYWAPNRVLIHFNRMWTQTETGWKVAQYLEDRFYGFSSADNLHDKTLVKALAKQIWKLRNWMCKWKTSKHITDWQDSSAGMQAGKRKVRRSNKYGMTHSRVPKLHCWKWSFLDRISKLLTQCCARQLFIWHCTFAGVNSTP